ncbi:MAG TPA: hypothetical protein VN603_12705 [Candidatus Acidoferrales bacterium]|nr:hypothetical protein [Candidatus Acidoferrales bacterium]
MAVAIASVQAFIDRKLEPNAETLGDVLAALEEVNRMLPLLREPREEK